VGWRAFICLLSRICFTKVKRQKQVMRDIQVLISNNRPWVFGKPAPDFVSVRTSKMEFFLDKKRIRIKLLILEVSSASIFTIIPTGQRHYERAGNFIS
jgi:hypothetical protein